jgi:hypothetical protein
MRYFFIHIPKTAGTSLRTLLYSNIEERAIVSAYAGDKVFNDLYQNPSKYQHKSYFIGHFNYGIHKILSFDPAECRYITFLRHPLERVISLYKHFARNSGTIEYELIKSRQLSLRQFLQLAINSQMSNHMVKIIANVDLQTSINSNHVSLALENIRSQFMYVGSMDYYAESVNELCDLLSWRNRPQIYQNRAMEQQNLWLTEADKSRIIALNQYDIQLYQQCYLNRTSMRQQQVHLLSLDIMILKSVLSIEVEF